MSIPLWGKGLVFVLFFLVVIISQNQELQRATSHNFPVRANSEYNEQTVYESVWRGLVRNTEEVLDFPAMFKQEATSPF